MSKTINLKFKKKIQRVEAFQMTKERINENEDWPEWLYISEADDLGALDTVFRFSDGPELAINTYQGRFKIYPGDWIVRHGCGSLEYFTDSSFEKNYEPDTES